MIPQHLVRFRKPLVMAAHLLLIPAGYMLALGLRLDFPLPEAGVRIFWETIPFLLAARIAAFALFRVFHGWWRHVGMNDLMGLVKAVSVSSALFLGALFLTGTLEGLPRSVLVLDWLMAVFLFGGIRFLVRGMREGHLARWGRRKGKAAVLVGAGEAAERLLRQLSRGNGETEIVPVALLDDDPLKRGMTMHGVPVVGMVPDLERVVASTAARMIVIAIPSASREQMKAIVERCMATGLEFKIVPSMVELMDGHTRVGQLRNVEIEDLLGRDAVSLDLSTVRRDIGGKVVLVTGGAGSIGSELARQVAACGPARLVLVEQAESPLYFVHLELKAKFPETEIVPVVADITDAGRMAQVFGLYRPHYVFHAAAYKHVPLMETNVVEAVRNNVLGTLNVVQCAERFRAEKFVLISTDKAVHPSSVMGATKRVAERIVLGWAKSASSGTDFRAVRFGNVLGSDGSVLPLFRRQLAVGGPLTITHPEVTRYFMTIPEAVQLVLQAGALPDAAGRILMLEMGEPVRVLDMAENLVRLSGLEPYKDVPIVFTGLRPGEKLHEELMSAVEETIPTAVEKIRMVRTDETRADLVQRGLENLAAAAAISDHNELVLALSALVPECVSPLRDAALAAAAARSTRGEDAGRAVPSR